MKPRQGLTRKPIIVGIALSVGLLHLVTGPAYDGPCRAFVNGYLIDVLLPFAMYLLLSLAEKPWALGVAARAVIVISFGAGVELAQFAGIPVFGRTYDPLDFAMYAVGVVCGVVFERLALSRLGAGR